MFSPITPLPSSVITLYAELLGQVKSAELGRSIADLSGNFTAKKIKGKSYWYLQHGESGKQYQTYLGPETPELLKAIKAHAEGKSFKQADQKNRERLCSMLLKGGIAAPDPLSARIVSLLAHSGLFRLGGILVGSLAFATYGPMLGVTWPTAMRTQDIDVAQDQNISVALSKEKRTIDLPAVLIRAQMGFHPIPMLNPKHPSTSFKLFGREMHLDILTPLMGRDTAKPVHLPALTSAAQPLRFLDYLIEEPETAVVVYQDGILVTIPTPARFAFHKLIVSQARTAGETAKAKKDIDQAFLLLTVLKESRPGDLLIAWDAVQARGKGWIAAIRKGLRVAEIQYPDLVNVLKDVTS